MTIDGDADFITNGWTGDGSSGTPFLLSSQTLGHLEIRNTRSHFIIEASTINASAIDAATSIELRNVTNGIVRDCSIYGQYAGLDIYNITDCEIVNNTLSTCWIQMIYGHRLLLENNSVLGASDFALQSYYTEMVEIRNNTLSRGLRGVILDGTNCTIRNNTIANHFNALELSWQTANTTITGNRFAACEGNITKDDGSDNTWLQNAWSDYSGYGLYAISGLAGSTDPSPSLFTPGFPLDVLGPTIVGLYVGSFLCIDFNERPSSFGFAATVTDVSGVEAVQVIINGEAHEMTHSPIETDPNRYVYDLPDPVSEGFMVMYYTASDTLGHSTETAIGQISIGVFPWGPSPYSPGDGSLLVFGLVLIPLVAVGAFIAWRYRQFHQPPRFN